MDLSMPRVCVLWLLSTLIHQVSSDGSYKSVPSGPLDSMLAVAPSPGTSVTIQNVHPTAVLLQWDRHMAREKDVDDAKKLTEVHVTPQMTYRHVASGDHDSAGKEAEVHVTNHNVTSSSHAPGQTYMLQHDGARLQWMQIKGLQPDTDYILELVEKAANGRKHNVGTLLFRTSPDGQVNLTWAEVCLIIGALCMWLLSVWMFLRKYAKNCLMEPREYRFECEPKNIETIRIVKELDDSVVHNTHNADYRRTSEARRVHLERLNSMPNMKVNTDLLRALHDEQNSTSPARSPLSPLTPLPEEQEQDEKEKKATNEVSNNDVEGAPKPTKKKFFQSLPRWNSSVEFSRSGLLNAISSVSLGSKENML